MGTSDRGRLAPSPTGYLHLGHARTFLVAAQRAAGGVLVLRSDDLDTQRVRPEFTVAMLEDLAWLGIEWQEGPLPSNGERGSFGPYRQSMRGNLYASAFHRLRDAGFVYPCRCSRRELALAAAAPHAEDEEPVYPGTCRERSVTDRETVAWRFRVPDGMTIEFLDGNLGPQHFVAGTHFGDFIVMRRDELPSYQLACAVDDEAMRITEVVRGRNLLRSTARQILLQRALHLPTPAYFHCELMVDAVGMRLAKRTDALSLRNLREQGRSASEVRSMAFAGPAV